ncbi:hypothetical protein [Citrobacter sp. Igbk 16]|uniref:hypothetical protein n=1 Tax=Citrobacter sp. Igbk 16 TaxID=2963958 RepID=UPI002302424E|nr:hypothetical protein [Citrobacter sp. Igbk 16]MDA8518968.1 hypothetical protein [Citrobacter sp. Igbk 16]
MRHFTSNQVDTFLNAFGETVIYGPSTFRAILDVRPIIIEGSEGLIESEEEYLSAKTIEIQSLDLSIDSQVTVRNKVYTVYRIYDDLSGVSEIYIRQTIAGLVF